MVDATTSPASTTSTPTDGASTPRPAPYEPPTLVLLGTLLDLTAGSSQPGPDPT